MFYEGPEASLDSNFLQNFSNRQLCNPAHGAIGTEGPVASTDEAVFGRFWVADAEDAALSGAGGDSDMRLQGSLVTP